jgi:predicted amidohydrolase
MANNTRSYMVSFAAYTLILLNFLLIILPAQSENDKGKLRIASSQFPVSADIDSNAFWIKKHIKAADEKGAALVHFPECALSGYAGVDFKTFVNFDWDNLKKRTGEILDLAKELKIWVLLGSTHRLNNNKPHNSLYVINPEGIIIDRYDKRFCTNGDLDNYSPGDHFVEFDVNGIKCGLLICYDVRFPELYRELKKMDVQVLFQSFYNARQKPGGIHPKIMPVTAQARAATNYFYMSITNSSAPNSWPCHFITPDGLILKKNEANIPALLISDININDKFYDASKRHRKDAINGKLNSGETIEDERSANRTSH